MSEKRNRRPSLTKEKTKNRKAQRSRAIRNRMILLVALGVIVLAGLGFLLCKVMGVFDEMPQSSTLTIEKDGTVICQEVTSFEEDYYSKKELKSFVKAEMKAYNQENGKGKITLNTVRKKGDTVYVKTTYQSVEDYSAFTGIEMSAGTVKSLKENYDFEDAFVTVKDGKKGDSAKTVDITSQSKLKALVIKENITVVTESDVVYVSDAATEMVDAKTVRITQPDGNEDATQLTYIIYNK